MSKLIAKFGGQYCEWSTVVDAPITYLMEKKEFTDFIKGEYGNSGLRDLPGRLARVEKQGTSSLEGTTVQDLLRYNRAGAGESHIATEEEMVEKFTFTGE